MKILSRIALLSFCIFALAACASPTPVPAAAAPATPTPTLAHPTMTALPLATATTLPTATVPPSPAPTNTATVAPSPSSVPSPMQVLAEITGEPNLLQRPSGLALDAQGNLYIVDAGNDRIQKFDPNGKPLAMWGKSGSGPGKFSFPRDRHDHIPLGGIGTDAQGNVYVSESGNHRVQKFDANGKFLMQWGSQGDGDGQFLDPIGVAVDRQGHVYVVDDDRNDIQKFDSQGKFLLKISEPGPEEDQLLDTGNISLDAQSNIWIADGGNLRVKEFDPNGKLLNSWGGFTCDSNAPMYPTALGFDKQGNVYVGLFNDELKPEQDCMVKLNPQGKLVFKWGHFGGADGNFSSALAVVVDNAQNIYVADYDNNRVQKFHQK